MSRSRLDRIAHYNATHAAQAGVHAPDIGADTWADLEGVKRWQAGVDLVADGWFGPKSVGVYLRLAACGEGAEASAPMPDQIPIFGQYYTVPGVDKVVYAPDALASRKRRQGTTVNAVIVHQSVTTSRKTTERVLKKRGLGVCALVEPDGTLYVYTDLGYEYTAHGNERNRTSVGLEMVNPYLPKYLRAPWTTVIDLSPVAWRRKEIEDTKAALKTAQAFIEFLVSQRFEGPGDRAVEIPREFPTTKSSAPCRAGRAYRGGWFDMEAGGVIAHGHRPSRYPTGHGKEGQRVRGAHADARRTTWLLKSSMEI